MTRTELREHIFKLLFQVEFNETADTTEPLACYLSTLDGVSEKDADYIGKKFKAIVSHISEIDEIINQYAKGWKTNRMNKVDLSILRLAVYEIHWDEAIPAGVAINEAVLLGKKFSGEEGPSFINGVLGKYVRSTEKTEEPEKTEKES